MRPRYDASPKSMTMPMLVGIGTALAALLFGALFTGTSTRNLDPDVFQPELASNLTLLIQGLVVLFVGVDLVVLWLLGRLRRRKAATA